MALLTTSVTVVVVGLPVAPEDVTLTVPVYVPAAKPDGFTETLSDPEVVLPLAGLADNQDPPDVVATAVVKLNAAPLLATEIF